MDRLLIDLINWSIMIMIFSLIHLQIIITILEVISAYLTIGLILSLHENRPRLWEGTNRKIPPAKKILSDIFFIPAQIIISSIIEIFLSLGKYTYKKWTGRNDQYAPGFKSPKTRPHL